jgi:hypothetical protein
MRTNIPGATALVETNLGGSLNPNPLGRLQAPEEESELSPSSSKGSVLEEALYYESLGFSVLPLQDNKRPFFKWEEFQKRRATPEEIKKWWKDYPRAMVGIVTGAISGVVVVDIDKQESKDAVKALIPQELFNPLALPICRTPRGGWHIYFKHPGQTIGNTVNLLPGVDFRGDGGYVVAPPSITGAGGAYSWLADLSIMRVTPPELPDTLKKSLLHNIYILSNKEIWGGMGGYGGG